MDGTSKGAMKGVCSIQKQEAAPAVHRKSNQWKSVKPRKVSCHVEWAAAPAAMACTLLSFPLLESETWIKGEKKKDTRIEEKTQEQKKRHKNSGRHSALAQGKCTDKSDMNPHLYSTINGINYQTLQMWKGLSQIQKAPNPNSVWICTSHSHTAFNRANGDTCQRELPSSLVQICSFLLFNFSTLSHRCSGNFQNLFFIQQTSILHLCFSYSLVCLDCFVVYITTIY